ncbi:hypothetical protein M8Q06_10320, partial [Enterobacter roggenkampii]|nr:hypothetical protein [Enterobacter roggenkampii]
KIGPDPRNFNQRVSLGRNDLLIRTFLSKNGEKSSDSNFTLSELLIRNIPNGLSGEMKLKKS